jgi:hypothetical protein
MAEEIEDLRRMLSDGNVSRNYLRNRISELERQRDELLKSLDELAELWEKNAVLYYITEPGAAEEAECDVYGTCAKELKEALSKAKEK